MPDDIPGGDMDACMNIMQEEEGHDEDAAARICQTLRDEAKAENGNVDELREALSRGRGLIADVGVELNSAVDRPAIDSEWVAFKSEGADGPDDANTQIDAPIVLRKDDDADAREEKRIAYAPAMIPRAIDKEGDVVSTPTVEQAAHDYVKSNGGVDSDHDLIDGKGEVVESWIEPEAKSWDTPDGGSKEYPTGTWMVGIEWDQETWKRIQEGELEGLSIYGKADHVPLSKADETAKEFVVPFADESVVELLYASRSVAAKAAERMGFEGDEEEITHPHEFGDETHYMPAPDHDAYVSAYNEFAEADGFGPADDDGSIVEASTEKADGDPCWDGYTMVGTDENGDPRCVPDDDVPDAEGFENAKVMDGSGPPADVRDGVTPKNAAGEANKQDSPMSDALEDRVETIESSVSDIEETVGTIKDAVNTDKEPGAGGEGGAIHQIAAELANHDDVAANAEQIASDLKSAYLSDGKEDGMDGEDDDEEDDDVDVNVESSDDEDDDEEKTAEKSVDDAEPNYGKADDGSDAAAVAKDAADTTGGMPAYEDVLEGK